MRDATTISTSRPERVCRWSLFTVLGLLCIGVPSVWLADYRTIEADAAAKVASMGATSFAAGDAFHLDGAAGHHGQWFQILPACSTALLLSPMLLLGAVATLAPRIRPRVAIAGLVAGASVLVLFGTARVAGVALAWHTWGDRSLWLTHALLGTLVSLMAGALAVMTQLSVMGWRGTPAGRSFASEP